MLKFWLPLAIASTIITLALYVITQQTFRLAANDPQIQLVNDGATSLLGGAFPAVLVGSTKVDMQKSLAPFVMVFDDSGKVIASSGYLNNSVPILPSGVFDYARSHADNRLTWQPASSTRIAAVIKHYTGKTTGFIVAGRNLQEVEDRIDQIQLIVISAWVAILVLTFMVTLYAWAVERKERELSQL